MDENAGVYGQRSPYLAAGSKIIFRSTCPIPSFAAWMSSNGAPAMCASGTPRSLQAPASLTACVREARWRSPCRAGLPSKALAAPLPPIARPASVPGITISPSWAERAALTARRGGWPMARGQRRGSARVRGFLTSLPRRICSANSVAPPPAARAPQAAAPRRRHPAAQDRVSELAL